MGHSVLEEVFGVDIPFDFNTMYFVDLKNLQLRKRDEYLMRVLLVASKKAITKKWLTNVIPTINEWIDLIYGIYIMERITFSFRGQSELSLYRELVLVDYLYLWPQDL